LTFDADHLEIIDVWCRSHAR